MSPPLHAAPEVIKRQINQGFFRKLIIDIDGTIERAELTEPFAQLLAPDWAAATDNAQHVSEVPGHLPTPRTPGEMPGVTAGRTTKNPDDDLVGGGSHKGPLVDLLEALANPCHEVQRLLALAPAWRNRDHGHDEGARRSPSTSGS
ncbi:MAG: hypothetical protein M3332_02270 [Actinomycetota bacterium]|nr:hypothetical protein [Actinomycetota bacterium]